MSVREVKIKISQLSKDFMEIIEKEKDTEKKVKLFESFYKTLNLIQEIYDPFKESKERLN
ncbi:MAG: hypothetical protein N2Z80_03305 [Hydrogenothermaceae bacterium]|nr:hypothetical protein [Hydrogenothermaceae bacterium]